ncbi:deoxyribose-phosphate aldolase [Neisseria animaloris]|nr:deoxyribose-phosphate aldolase [Neisseria animaloris]
MEVARYIDHTLLKAVARQEDIRKLCDEAKAHGFFFGMCERCQCGVRRKPSGRQRD